MTEKHVVAINGSPRQGNTLALLEQIARALEPHGVRVTIVNMGRYHIKDCAGCEHCIRKGGWCVQEDGAREILEQLLDADGFILASPVFFMQLTGRLKSLIDKTASWFHRPPLVGKPALVVSTTAGAGHTDTMKYLEDVAMLWGGMPVGRFAWTASKAPAPDPRVIRRFVWHLDHEPCHYRPTTRQLSFYAVQKVLALKLSKLDQEFWRGRGWDKRNFYYPCRLGLWPRFNGDLLYFILNRTVKMKSTF